MPSAPQGTGGIRRRPGLPATLCLLVLGLAMPGDARLSRSRSSYAYIPPPLDRVPTFRLYHKGVCCDQIGGAGEVEDCRRALHASIKGHLGTVRVAAPKRAAEVLELDDTADMEDFLKQTEDKWALLCFYGAWCQQCQMLEPLFQTLPYVYRDKPLIFARADIARFHDLVAKKDHDQELEEVQLQPMARKGIVERTRQDPEDRVSGCKRCGGTGFIDCDVCENKGHVIREAEGYKVADVCPRCVGHRKLRCPECGGKCYMCE